jgi:ubiquinone/menaquinone biosynthesis C-methylase UbiE
LVERRLVATLLHSADLSRTLEVGTGEGRLTYLLAGRSDRMFGIDLDGQRIRTLRNRLAGDGVEIGLARADARWLPFADGAFSTVVLVRVLHRFAAATGFFSCRR